MFIIATIITKIMKKIAPTTCPWEEIPHALKAANANRRNRNTTAYAMYIKITTCIGLWIAINNTIKIINSIKCNKNRTNIHFFVDLMDFKSM